MAASEQLILCCLPSFFFSNEGLCIAISRGRKTVVHTHAHHLNQDLQPHRNLTQTHLNHCFLYQELMILQFTTHRHEHKHESAAAAQAIFTIRGEWNKKNLPRSGIYLFLFPIYKTRFYH